MATVRIEGVIQNTREISIKLTPTPPCTTSLVHIPYKDADIIHLGTHIICTYYSRSALRNRIEEVKSKQKKERNINLEADKGVCGGGYPPLWANGTERIETEIK